MMTPKRRRYFILAALIVSVVAIAPAYLSAFTIKVGGVSEVPTILPGDVIVVNRAAYTARLPYSTIALVHVGTIRRGDMVLVALPTGGVAPKRVLGVPGDTFEMIENQVILNSKPLPTVTLERTDFAWVPAASRLGSRVLDEDGHWSSFTPGRGTHRDYPPTRVMKDHFFVVGDNRDESEDSRVWGAVSQDRILGKVILVLPTGRRVKQE